MCHILWKTPDDMYVVIFKELTLSIFLIMHLCICLLNCVPSTCSAHSGQKRASGSLDSESRVVVSHRIEVLRTELKFSLLERSEHSSSLHRLFSPKLYISRRNLDLSQGLSNVLCLTYISWGAWILIEPHMAGGMCNHICQKTIVLQGMRFQDRHNTHLHSGHCAQHTLTSLWRRFLFSFIEILNF